MKTNHLDEIPEFVEFNDENLEHVLAGPDYGQPWHLEHGWTELDSVEYSDFYDSLSQKILTNHVNIEKSC